MGIAERRAREKEEMRQQILDAAVEIFKEKGFEKVQIRKIAEKIEFLFQTAPIVSRINGPVPWARLRFWYRPYRPV